MSDLRLVPITFAQAKAFVYEHHRHNPPPITWRFGVGLVNDEGLVGVAIAGLPNARMSADGETIEVLRVATDGSKNANSMLYGAILRAAKALGYKRAITYTLDTESGVSLKASGWTQTGTTNGHGDWKPRNKQEQQLLFGERYPKHEGDKIRWEWTTK